MLTLTALTLAGVQRLRGRWLGRFDRRAIGALLALLGLASLVIAH